MLSRVPVNIPGVTGHSSHSYGRSPVMHDNIAGALLAAISVLALIVATLWVGVSDE